MSKSDDTISRRDAIDALTDFILVDYPTRKLAQESAEMVIGQVPSAEPKTVEWVKVDNWGGFRCDKCGWEMVGTSRFCPNCGARMRGGE